MTDLVKRLVLHVRSLVTDGGPRAVAVQGAAAGGPPESAEAQRRRQGLRQEIAVRIAVAAIVLAFNQLFDLEPETASVIRLTALIGLGMNVPYLVAIRTGRALRARRTCARSSTSRS
jgi:hypothetical protein